MRPASRLGLAVVGPVVIAAGLLWWRGALGDHRGDDGHPNVILITIDTLRADRVGHGLTPAIDRLAQAGVTFTAARATAPLTLPSHVSLMTGTRPPLHGVHLNGTDRLGADPTPLADVFRRQGYHTGAFVSAYVLDRRFGLDRGFDTYDDKILRNPDAAGRLEAERPGARTMDAALAWLRTSGPTAGASTPVPVFLWVHLYEPHAPYAPPPAFLARAGGAPYDGEVAAADAQVGRLLEVVEPEVIAGRTIVIVTGDHGESLGDHGEATHGMLLYDAAIRVPLVIAAPTRWEAGARGGPVSLADVAPTVLRLAGIAAPATMTGIDLLDRAAARDVYAETNYPEAAGWSRLASLQDDRWKLVASSEVELYDLSADAGETTNVAAAQPSVTQAMRSKLDALRQGATRTESPAVSREAADRLRALGYAASAPRGATTPARGINPSTVIGAWNTFETALADLTSGQPSRAATTLDRLVGEFPEAPIFRTTRARAWLDAGDAPRALVAYREAARRWPTDPVLLHDLAVAAREAGAIEEAVRAERAAIAVDADHPAAWNGLGLLLADQSRAAEAADAFRRAADLDPTNASYWTNLGNARREQRDLTGAELAYRRALDVDASSADALNGLGVLLVQAGRPADAVGLFERALTGSPDFHEARLNLAIAYEQSGQIALARATLEHLLASAPASSLRERQAATALLKSLAGK